MDALRRFCCGPHSESLHGRQTDYQISSAACLRAGSGIRLSQSTRVRSASVQILSLKHRWRQETIALFLNHGITLATQLFQPRPVQYRDLSTDVADNTELVQLAGGFGDAFTAHAEHIGDELLGHGQLVG